MAETGGTYLPPVVASLVGEIGGLAKTLVEAKAMVADFAKTDATVKITAELTSLANLQADLFQDLGGVQALAEAHPIDVPMQLDMFKILSDTAAFRLFAEKPIKVNYDLSLSYMQMAADRELIGASMGRAVSSGFWNAILGAFTGKAGAAAGGGGAGLASSLGFGTAGFGAGAFGLAGFGSIASLAGFGLERVITLVIGLVGSLTQAIGGLGVIAAGTFATMAVGMGSDMLVMKSTIADTQTFYTLWTNLQQAVLLYGQNSIQAQNATTALNQQLLILGNTAGTQAELGLAKLAFTLNQQWDQATSNARVQTVDLLTQVLFLAQTYIPLVAGAAQQNLAIINAALGGPQGLFSWLKGPATAIFSDLENKFARDLPTAMHAFTQAVEVTIRFLDLASNYTGGFVEALDRLFTYLNSPAGWQRVVTDVGQVISVFDVWKGFIVILLKDVALLFGQAVGVGTTMVSMLTGILNKLHDYLSSASGKNALNNLFTVHKNEIVALLNLLPQLAPAFSVYLALAVPLTTIATDVIKLLNFMLSIPAVGPAIAWGLALIIIVNQMKLMAVYGSLAAMIRGIGSAIEFAGILASGATIDFGGLAISMGGVAIGGVAITAPLIIIIALLAAVAVLVFLLVTHWQQLGTLLGGFGALFKTLALEIFAAAVIGLTGWSQTFSLLGTLLHNALGQWGAAFSEMGLAAHMEIDKIGGEFTTAFSQWGAAFSMIGTTFHTLWFNIGGSIVTGLVSGINNLWSWAQGQVRAFFQGLYNAARHAIQPGSGSKVYAALAASIPQGVADGVTKNTAMTLTAISSMFNQMQNHGRMLAGAGGYGSPSFALAGAGGRGPISINMPVTVQVSGATAATPQGIGTAVQKSIQQEIDRVVQALQGGIYSSPGQG